MAIRLNKLKNCCTSYVGQLVAKLDIKYGDTPREMMHSSRNFPSVRNSVQDATFCYKEQQNWAFPLCCERLRRAHNGVGKRTRLGIMFMENN